MFDAKLSNIKWLEERGVMDHILSADPTNEQGLAHSHDDVTLIDFLTFPALFQEGHVDDYNYPRPELYVEDGAHFNQVGYAVYRDIFLEVLDDVL